jgi:hypothetical protein
MEASQLYQTKALLFNTIKQTRLQEPPKNEMRAIISIQEFIPILKICCNKLVKNVYICATILFSPFFPTAYSSQSTDTAFFCILLML